ncbi:kinesin family member 3/17 [Monoraphidium neglectum]|uniref:Kinesin-like protein n=1 Tax=Monoraphidium neglectum TaxID=145388 RepID=A0A0D2JQ79_9CHLO|nr:kinesin family member 3/17 [Monoraphidium neglectum]KIZ01228.1 kinesin family member 3/17 [Monoraphidium neglectum]|eukprot:XP_013900247.1 kinesin family member 3/17 [Monoraphidium neglectum]
MSGSGAPRPSVPGKKSEESVCVAVNIRPLIEIELDQGCQECLYVTPGLGQVHTAGNSQSFTYDHVFGGDYGSDLSDLYPKCVAPLLDGLFKGYNATVFAYGQTGSGKTYAMGSGFTPGGPCRGVIPEAMEELFARVEAGKEGVEFSVRVSFVEIHKEEVRDLLFVEGRGARPQVTIRELPGGVTLAGAVEREVHSREEMAGVLEQGSLCRAVGATNMNNRSSRSHAIFTITLEQRRADPAPPTASRPASPARRAAAAAAGDAAAAAALVVEAAEEEEEDEEDDGDEGADGEGDAADDYLIAKMHLVDLAGSERAKRTGAEGARLREAININKGLLALAKVISALVDCQGHVPYRDSKLTRLLQDSLGGNSRTLMLACVSPADVNREESLNTLRYADRARHIKNKPVVNRDPVAAQLRQQLAALRAENLALKRTIGAAGGDPDALAALVSGGALPPGEALREAYDELAMRCGALEAQHARDQGELDDLRSEASDLRERALAAETARDSARLRLRAMKQAAVDAGYEKLSALHTGASEGASCGGAAALADGAASAAAGMGGGPAADGGDAEASAGAANSSAVMAAAASQDDDVSLDADVDVVAELRGRIAELEAQLRQARSLQRAQSSMLRSGAADGVAAAAVAAAAAGGAGRRRAGSAAGGGAGAVGPSRYASSAGAAATALDVLDCGGSPPLSPAHRPAVEPLPSPLEEGDSSRDAELIAGTTAHFVSQEQLKHRLAAIGRQMVAKQRRLAALQGAVAGDGLKAQYDGHLQALQAERDALLKEKTGLLQKLHKAAEASLEERRRLESLYRDKLAAVERRVKELGEKEREARRGAKQLTRVEQVVRQLQEDIQKMKGHKAAVLRRMELREREFREWRTARERELAQLRRSAQRQNAALQQHQAMHVKQQAVLKRKTEEAEAAKKRLRELMEVQARARIQRTDAAAREAMEMQPNAGAPLLRSERARKEWVEQELDLCNTSWEYMKRCHPCVHSSHD